MLKSYLKKLLYFPAHNNGIKANARYFRLLPTGNLGDIGEFRLAQVLLLCKRHYTNVAYY